MKNKKGFTLIELLAVIVILGLLMAIAIPSITKYITESRKKTLVSTIGNYMSALSNEVNDLTYTFTEENTIYAVPIECIPLERGGTDPFGEWHQSSSSYWAYVLVQYDDETSSYRYGYTFKDSAGYGIYPTTQAKLNEKGSQINTDLDLRKLVSGSYINGADKENWIGFDIDEETKIRVLKSELEGDIGDGINTCTLSQKGTNYESVQEEYKDRTLVGYRESTYFWEYKEKIKNVTFQNYIDIPDSAVKYWDVSNKQNGMVMAYIEENPIDSNYYDLYIQANGEIYANSNTSHLFDGFLNLDSIQNIEVLNTSKVTNMDSMFKSAGYNSTIFTLDLGDNFDTSNVTLMREMFRYAGYNSAVFTLDLGDNFDTSNVTSMFLMFANVGRNSTMFTLDLGDKFDTSNVTMMNSMFSYAGYFSPVFMLDLGDKFDTSNVTGMNAMFAGVGFSNPVFTLDLESKFDTSNVTDMRNMFNGTGAKSSLFKLDCSNWDVSKVIDYGYFNHGAESKITPPNWVN